MIVDVYEGDTDEVLPVTRDELGNLALGSELCGMRGDCNDLATVRVATCHDVTSAPWKGVYFTCSQCGCIVRLRRAEADAFENVTYVPTLMMPNGRGRELSFCPNCGRKVVSDD